MTALYIAVIAGVAVTGALIAGAVAAERIRLLCDLDPPTRPQLQEDGHDLLDDLMAIADSTSNHTRADDQFWHVVRGMHTGNES